MNCQHENFRAMVNVGRILGKDEKTVEAYMAEVTIACTECGLPFEFVGVNAGLRYDKPMASPDAQELRAPIRPKGYKLLPALPGFEIRAN
jgi:hypothetical protein